ncbi:Peptidoglycan D,D-transpeptidase MrdA [Acaryochloris thomasi RCC1774]|uniref:Peptidoglycan D,D-transpeptidase MrdA n=1 Tax=Acaryochloris thomasi RCC1774 TaxID=1764569 RepID=A0A2W1JD74_9CYAN|nr:penicillin-binding protein 2 [Acaryochloris thomasi]PZD71870.1 Peptidoglycan D,D-transpeptidase MrdA [Acaryochloris thomasi RCC1774]
MLLQSPPRRPGSERVVGEGLRSFVFVGFVTVVLFGALGSRLGVLQLVQGERNRELANENRIRLIPKRPERGKIRDRKGRDLATSDFTYSVFVWPLVQGDSQWPRTLKILSNILQIPETEIQKPLEEAGENSPSLVRISQGLSFPQVVALEERSTELVGVEIDKEAIRFYPHGELAAQVLGYIGEINAEEYAEKKDQGYRLGDVIGKSGLESQYQETLHGVWGGQQVEVDGAGGIVRVLGQKPPQAGDSITLTLDLDVQKAAEQALGNRPGAVVALDPRDGSVRAMVSHPGFDPNWFVQGISSANWKTIQERKFPLVNRATRAFPPASTFKVITAVAGMESGKYAPNARLSTYASIHGVGSWNGAGFGVIGFRQALQWSSNTFFGQVAVKVGPDEMLKWSQRFGMGEKTGVDLPSESAGFIPTPTWKRKVFENDWYPADSVMVSIGQGAVQASPLQAAAMFAAIANDGYRVKPHFLRTDAPAESYRTSLDLKSSTLKTIQAGLRDVVTSGTGKALNVPTLPPSAGKSGTGEDPPRPTHTWFGGYAPFDKPELVVVAFGQNTGGGGGSTCGPIVRQVLEAYFKHNPVKKKT